MEEMIRGEALEDPDFARFDNEEAAASLELQNQLNLQHNDKIRALFCEQTISLVLQIQLTIDTLQLCWGVASEG